MGARARRLLAASAAVALFAGPAAAANVPPVNLPSMADWEQNALSNLDGPSGLPLAIGAPPTPTGTCAVNTQVGGQAGGSFKANGACASSGTIILTFLTAAPNGVDCSAKDVTTTADTLTETSFTTTSATFTSSTGLASADVVVFSCRAF